MDLDTDRVFNRPKTALQNGYSTYWDLWSGPAGEIIGRLELVVTVRGRIGADKLPSSANAGGFFKTHPESLRFLTLDIVLWICHIYRERSFGELVWEDLFCGEGCCQSLG